MGITFQSPVYKFSNKCFVFSLNKKNGTGTYHHSTVKAGPNHFLFYKINKFGSSVHESSFSLKTEFLSEKCSECVVIHCT